MSIEVMKQALEALVLWEDEAPHAWSKADELAVTALRQAIDQAELVQRAEEAFDRSEQYVMKNAQGELERISLVQTGVGIGKQVHPVAWMYDFLNPDSTDEVIRNWVTQDLSEIDGAKGFNVRPLYTVPPQRQPLDDLTILDIADKHLHDQETYQALAFARAIEREIKENK